MESIHGLRPEIVFKVVDKYDTMYAPDERGLTLRNDPVPLGDKAAALPSARQTSISISIARLISLTRLSSRKTWLLTYRRPSHGPGAAVAMARKPEQREGSSYGIALVQDSLHDAGHQRLIE